MYATEIQGNDIAKAIQGFILKLISVFVSHLDFTVRLMNQEFFRLVSFSFVFDIFFCVRASLLYQIYVIT